MAVERKNAIQEKFLLTWDVINLSQESFDKQEPESLTLCEIRNN